MAQPTDEEFVRQSRAGDHNAYKELVVRYQGHVYGLAYSLVGNWVDAQDIAQETFIRAYMNLDQLRDPARFAAWLRRVAFSVAMNWLKAFRPKLFKQLDGKIDLDHLDIPDFRPGPPEIVEKRDLAEAVLKAVQSLPQKYRVPLTMFHLDGLSYSKVADFLDMPLNTAKSLIYRAKEKLKPALGMYAAEEISPVVQEVFNEHKLPEEFSMKVLENIEDLDYRKGDCAFTGSVVACMNFLKEQVTRPFVMGVSGSAFKLLWYLQWCPSNNSMGVLGTEPIRRTFRSLGYEYEFVPKTESPDCREQFRRKVINSIDAGRPIIAYGIVGAPDEGIVAGYDKNGDVVLGRSYFYDSSKGYYEKSDWYKDCCGLILIGDKKQPPKKKEILSEALGWAVNLARIPEWSRHDGAKYGCGLAAYDAWAQALKKDNDFPEGDLEILTFRCLVNSNVTFCGLLDGRRAAAAFIKSMAVTDKNAAENLLAAVAMYDEEVAILESMINSIPYSWQPEEKRLQMADPKLRQNIAKLIVEAKSKDEKAVEYLEQALEVLKD